ncbi:MAG: hypothetical protein AAF191_19885 [Verrucomicrobiota bacterium]
MGDSIGLAQLTVHLESLVEGNPGFSGADLLDALETEGSPLANQIRDVAERPELRKSWGWSSNIDSGAKVPVVVPGLLMALGEAAGLGGAKKDKDGGLFHAGILHTYGYLLSNVETPFGQKRDRWCQGNLARGLGLPESFLSPEPSSGSLFENVTAVFSEVLGESSLGLLPSSVTDGHQLVEVLSEEEEVELVTVLLSFPEAPRKAKETVALFYAIRERGQLRYITVFPTGGWVLKKLKKSASPPADGAWRNATLRYNARMPGKPGPFPVSEVRWEAWQRA